MDMIFINGEIATIDSNKSFVEAIAVKDGIISKLGSNEDILQCKTDETNVIDLEGKLMLPGFNDSHMHLLNYGQYLQMVDLVGAESIEEIIKRSKNFIKENNLEEGQWVKGGGWNNDYFRGDKIFPTKYDLDRITTEEPVILWRTCGHIAIVNSKALEVAGITKDTPQVDGGHFDVDKSGEILGIFRENAIDLIKKHIPCPNIDDIKKMLKDAIKNANTCGITSVQTDDFGAIPGGNYENIIKAYEEIKKEREMTLRVYEQCLIQKEEKLQEFLDKGYNTGYGDEVFKIGPLKLLGDGSLGARTAALTKPYNDAPATSGIPIFTQEEINGLAEKAHLNGMQIAIHAIGDKTMYMAFEAIEKALEKGPKKDHRHGIVHCQITDDYLLKRYKELDVVAYIQPIFLDYDWQMVESRIGKHLMKTSYNWKTLSSKGVHLACGSDCPVESFDVMNGIYTAVTRKGLKGKPEGGWMPEQKLTVEEAVYGFTMGGAFASFEDKIKGSIEEGKLADMVILSENIFKISEDEIKDVKIDMTIFGGKVVYERL